MSTLPRQLDASAVFLQSPRCARASSRSAPHRKFLGSAVAIGVLGATVLCATVLSPSLTWAQTRVAARPEVICTSEADLVAMKRPHRQASRPTIAAQPANQLTLAGGCIRVPAGAEMRIQIVRKKSSIVVYDAQDGSGPQAYVAPNAMFASVGRQGAAAGGRCLKQTAKVTLHGIVGEVSDTATGTGDRTASFVLHVPSPICVAGGPEDGKDGLRTRDVILEPKNGQAVALRQRTGRLVAVVGTISASATESAILHDPSFR